MDPTTGIYSCDDHLDLSAVPPDAVAVAAAARARPSAVRASTTRDGKPVWVCEDRVHRPQRQRRGERGREEAQRDRARRHRRRRLPRRHARSCGSRTWTATACAASVIYGPLALGLPIDDPDAAERVLRRVERLGGRGVQRGRPGPAVRARVPARPLARGRGGRARALRRRSATAARSSTSSTSTSATRRGTGCGPRRSDTGLPISFHIKGGTSSKLSYRIGKWQSAAFATLLPLQLDEPLATMMFCGALERHPGLTARARGVGHRLAARTSWRAWTSSGDALRDKLDYAPTIAAERAVPPPGDGHVRGGRARPRSSSRCSAPTRACGRPTIRTPTARSRTRCTRSRRRSARCPPRTAARSPRPTARGCTASPMPDPAQGAIAGFDHVSLPMQHTDAMVAFYRALGFDVAEHPHFVSVYVGDQMINLHRPEIWQREGLHAARHRRRRRRAATSASCGTDQPKRCTRCSTQAGAAIDRGPGRARRRSPGCRHRASTYATPTGTSSSS